MNRTRCFSFVAATTAALLLGIATPTFAGPPADDTASKAESHADRKPQSELASKSATFATVAASDPSVKKALAATDLKGALKMDGKSGAFTGTVATAFAPHSNSIVILNFAKDYHTAVSAVVFAKSFSAFPDLKTLEGKKVLITGSFKNYHDSPEIILDSPSQVKIIK